MENKELKPLTTQELLFIDAYLSNGFNGTKAAMSAKYSPRNSANIASSLLKRAEVIAEIEKFLADSRTNSENLRQTVMELWAAIATVTIDMFIEKVIRQGKRAGTVVWKDIKDWTPEMKKACSGIKYDRYGVMTIELNGKQWASDSIAKYLGLWREEDKGKGNNQNNVVFYLPDNGRGAGGQQAEPVQAQEVTTKSNRE